jgi:hypothetical protein
MQNLFWWYAMVNHNKYHGQQILVTSALHCHYYMALKFTDIRFSAGKGVKSCLLNISNFYSAILPVQGTVLQNMISSEMPVFRIICAFTDADLRSAAVPGHDAHKV